MNTTIDPNTGQYELTAEEITDLETTSAPPQVRTDVICQILRNIFGEEDMDSDLCQNLYWDYVYRYDDNGRETCRDTLVLEEW